jgi:hypothetical protein
MVHPRSFIGYSIYRIKPNKSAISRNGAKRRPWWKGYSLHYGVSGMYVEVYMCVKPRREKPYQQIGLARR